MPDRLNRPRGMTWLLLMVFVVGCQQEPPTRGSLKQKSTDKTTKDLSPGVYQQTLPRDGESPLRYTIRIPQTYSKSESVPLILALHFGGKVTPFYGEGIVSVLMEPAFRNTEAIIVAPDSIAGPWTNEENEAAVLQIYDHILKTFRIDRSRVLLTGFSMGGHGTWYIAGRNQDRFSAVIPIAGTPSKGVEKWNIPVYAIHSNADTVVPIQPTRDYVKERSDMGEDIQLVELDGIPHFETYRFAEPLHQAIPWLRTVWGELAEYTPEHSGHSHSHD